MSIPRYLDIVQWRREGKTFQWIADQLKISRQRAWELHKRACNRIENVTGKVTHGKGKSKAA